MIKQTAETQQAKKLHTRFLYSYDYIRGASISGMPSVANGNRKHVMEWSESSENISVVPNFSMISKRSTNLHEGYFVINGLLHFVSQHLLVLRKGFWSWRSINSVKEMDYIYSEKGYIKVESIEYLKQLCTVQKIEQECNDAVFINGVLVYSGAQNAD